MTHSTSVKRDSAYAYWTGAKERAANWKVISDDWQSYGIEDAADEPNTTDGDDWLELE